MGSHLQFIDFLLRLGVLFIATADTMFSGSFISSARCSTFCVSPIVCANAYRLLVYFKKMGSHLQFIDFLLRLGVLYIATADGCIISSRLDICTLSLDVRT